MKRKSILVVIAAAIVPIFAAYAHAALTLPSEYSERFTFGDSLPDLGFRNTSYWALDTIQRCMVSQSPGGWSYLSKTTTSPFEINREDGTIAVSWSMKYPTEYGGSWRELNKSWLSICDTAGATLYTLMCKPNREQDRYTSYDMELTANVGGSEQVLQQAWTHTLTPHGANAEWVRFRIEFEGSPMGQIRVYYDVGDGNGYVKYIEVTDMTHSAFGSLQFKYRTGDGDRNYHILVDNLHMGLSAAENEIIPDTITTLLGDEISASNTALPNRWVADSSRELTITYRLPFPYWRDVKTPGDFVTVDLPRGAVASYYNPVIFIDDTGSTNFPSVNLPEGSQLLGAYTLHGDLATGHTLCFPFPYHDFTPRVYGDNSVAISYFDPDNQVWQDVPIERVDYNAVYAIVDRINTNYVMSVSTDVILVDPNVAASGSGRGWWNEAVQTLPEALDLASVGDEIWVRSGTYYPGTTGQQDATFELVSGVTIRGGFGGYESLAEQRRMDAAPSILSGDIDRDGTLAGNSFTVVFAEGLLHETILDRFVIEDARGWAGAGLYIFLSRIRLENCTFRNCHSTSSTFGGGAIFKEHYGGQLKLHNCRFVGNTAQNSGGAVYMWSGADEYISHCSFMDNEAADGGAIASWAAAPYIWSSVFASNTASGRGGAVYYSGRSAGPRVFHNCTFGGNSAANGGAIYNDYGDAGDMLTIANCIVWGNASSSNGSQIYVRESSCEVDHTTLQGGIASIFVENASLHDNGNNLSTDPLFADVSSPAGGDGIGGTWDDGLRLASSNSPCFQSGTDLSGAWPEVHDDILGQARPTGVAVDRGAYWITAPENPGFAVDFVEHPDHEFGFDKVSHTSTQTDPDEIYLCMPRDFTTSVIVVAENPTGMYVQSSDETVFQVTTDGTNRVALDRNATPIALMAQNPAAVRTNAQLEVCDAVGTVSRALNVEVYRYVWVPSLGYHRVTDAHSPATATDLIDATEEAILNETNLGFKQVVVEVERVDRSVRDIRYDLNNNGWVEHFPGPNGFPGPNPEVDAITGAGGYVSTHNICLIRNFRMAYELSTAVNAGETTLEIESNAWLQTGWNMELEAAAGHTEWVTLSSDPVANAAGNWVVNLAEPVANNYAAGDILLIGLGGLSTTPPIIRSHPGFFQIIVHELLHTGPFGRLRDVDATDNVMNHAVVNSAWHLRFREQPQYYNHGMTENQWRRIAR